MNRQGIALDGIEDDILDILYRYIKVQSFTDTEKEKEAGKFLTDYLSGIPYFKENPEYYGIHSIHGDFNHRGVCYAFVKGQSPETVILLHHEDIVGIEDFKLLKPYAFSPDDLEKKLWDIKDSLPKEVQKDLSDKTFLFGRGSADMKGGGAIQLALLKRYSQMSDFTGNVLVIAVPDEEGISAGMRAAIELLAELKDTYGFDYKLMINSEPHQRKNVSQGILSEGSVGKMMPFIYVRGYLSHIGKVFEGFNPLNLMSEIVRRTELNMDFSDSVGNESAPPPTWLYLKDSKRHYDVSMPLSASGCFSVLTLNQTPAEVMEKVQTICTESFDTILKDMHASHERFSETAEPVIHELPWKTNVMMFEQFYREAYKKHGESFKKSFDKKLESLFLDIQSGKGNIIESNFALIEFIFDYFDDLSPRVVYGLIPPYYPGTSNYYLTDLDPAITSLSHDLNQFTEEEFGQSYTSEFFYTGISDLSYANIRDGDEILTSLQKSMPFWGEFYNIPIETIKAISMPCMNIGPWGKDFHKLTERVNKEDLYIRTPRIIDKAISLIL